MQTACQKSVEFMFNGATYRANYFGFISDWSLDEVTTEAGEDICDFPDADAIAEAALQANPDGE